MLPASGCLLTAVEAVSSEQNSTSEDETPTRTSSLGRFLTRNRVLAKDRLVSRCLAVLRLDGPGLLASAANDSGLSLSAGERPDPSS